MKKLIILTLFFITMENLPAKVHYWKNIDGLYGGLISSMVVSGNDIYCAGRGGVYKSTDNGESWFTLGLNDKFIWKICIIYNYIFAISEEGCFRMNLTDNTWINVKEGNWRALYAKDSVIFIGGEYQGVFRSTDFGHSWQETNNGIDNRSIRHIFITSNNIVLASAAGTSGSGVFRSTDNGNSWKRIDPYKYAWNFEGIAEFKGILYAFDSENMAKVYMSTDFGLTWFLPRGTRAPSDIIQSIYVDDTGIYVGVYHYGLFKSTTQGVSWVHLNSGLDSKEVFVISGDTKNLFCGTFDGIYRTSKNSISWMKKSKGINGVWITALAEFKGKLLIGTYGSGLFIYENNTLNRILIETDLMFIVDIQTNGNQIYVISSSWFPTFSSKFHYSKDGKTWVPVNDGFDAGQLHCIAVNDKYIYVGSSFGLFRKPIDGNYWHKIRIGIPENIVVISIGISDSVVILNSGISLIYISTNYGNSWSSMYVPGILYSTKLYSRNKGEFYLGCAQVNMLFKSTDFGFTWNKVEIPLFNSSIQSIFINNKELFIGLSKHGILVSSDNGISWVHSNLGLISRDITCFTSIGDIVFVGTGTSGLYHRIIDFTRPIGIDTSDYSKEFIFKWTSSYGINRYRFQLAEDSLFKNLLIDDQNVFDTSYTVTYLDFNKVYYWRVSSVTNHWNDHFTKTQIFKTGNPKVFKIYQNYPNPFNNQTTIRFDISDLSWVKLELYDILGRKIKTLINEQKTPGTYKYILENNDISSGVYIVKLKSDNLSQSIKVLLIK